MISTSKWSASLVAAVLACGLAGSDDASAHAKKNYAAGQPGDPKQPARDITVTMLEDGKKMLFEPAYIVVEQGEQIRFVLANDGVWEHEFMLDSFAGNAKHKKVMEKNPGMEHDDPNGKTINVAARAEMLWKFTKLGKYEYACLLPGHYEAGMKGVVEVVPKRAAVKRGAASRSERPTTVKAK
jgi:uncharacterized cupredoxin-like copper-binding protein